MRFIRHAAPTLYKTINPSSPRYLSKPAQSDSLRYEKGASPSAKGKEKEAMGVQFRAQGLEAPRQVKSPRVQAKKLARHANLSSDPIPRLCEGAETPKEPPFNPQKSKSHNPVMSGFFGGKHYFSHLDPFKKFLETPRLSPLLETHTEPITVEIHTRLYRPRRNSPAFRPKVPESVSTSKKRPTRRRRASWFPLPRVAEHASGSSRPSTRSQLPVLYFNLPNPPSSHRRVNALTNQKVWEQSPRMSPLEISHTPLPLSHGSGEVDRRAERYRKTRQERERSAQGVVHGLGRREAGEGQGSSSVESGGKKEDLEDSEGSSNPRSSSGTAASTQSDSYASSSKSLNSRRGGPLLSGFDCRSNRAGLLPSLAVQRSWKCTSRQYTSGQEHSTTRIEPNASPEAPTPSQVGSSSISGFSVGWKGDDWKDDWGEDRLASPVSRVSQLRTTLLSRLGELANPRQSRLGLPRAIPRPRPKVTRLLTPPVAPPSLPISHSLKESDPRKFRDSESRKVLPPSSLARRLRVIDQMGNIGTAYRWRGKARLRPLIGDEGTKVAHPSIPQELLPSEALPLDKNLARVQGTASRLTQRLEHLAAIGAITREATHTALKKGIEDVGGPSAHPVDMKSQNGSEIGSEEITVPKRYARKAPLNLISRIVRMLSVSHPPAKSAAGTAMDTEVVLSRKAIKAKALAAKIKAKQDFISRLAPTKNRKEARALRKKKKADASKSVLAGHLKPLTTGEEVLQDVQPPHAQRPIARLAHGLDRVLFNQSVHWLQDPHSRVFNFSPVLQSLPAVTDFAFERIPPYVSSSRDEDLHTLALRHSKQFAGSTSSLTKLLSHIYFLISGDRPVDTSTLSMAFLKEPRTFTPGLRLPATFVLHHRENPLNKHNEPVISPSLAETLLSPDAEHITSSDANEAGQLTHTYAIDSGLGDPNERREAELNVLLWLGTMAEKFLTMSQPAFSALLRRNPGSAALPEDRRPEAYRYSKSSKFVMRSQLDCQDSRLPGTGVFDIKTRAALPIRIDQLNYQENSGYLIRKMTGLLESFEREYYDLIRSAFLKYNFQARIGNMDGVFVAYHNTARMFGFQYVPVKEMEARLYGPGPPDRGDRIFEKCVGLMEVLIKELVQCFPGESLSCTVEAREGAGYLRAWVVPLVWTKDEPKPVAELRVNVSHMINNHAVSSKAAIDRADENWVMLYHVHRVHSSQSQIWAALHGSQARQFSLALPEGVAGDEMRSKLANVDYGAGLGLQLKPLPAEGEDQPAAADSDDTKEKMELHLSRQFRKPSRNVRHLRQLAKAGRADLEREAELEAQPVVWGRDFDVGWIAEPSPEITALEDSKEAVDMETWEEVEEDEALEGVQDIADVDGVLQGVVYHTTTASDQDVRDGIQELGADQSAEETVSRGGAPPSSWTERIRNTYASYNL